MKRSWESLTAIPEDLSAFIDSSNSNLCASARRRRRSVGSGGWLCGVAGPSLLGQEEGLAFLYDLQQNHGGEGRTINQAGGAYSFYEKGWLEGTAVPFF